MLNAVSIIGVVANEPTECIDRRTGKHFVYFSIKSQTTRALGELTTHYDYIPCEAWGGTVDRVKRYCQKGAMVAIKGTLRSENYGEEKLRTRVVIRVELVFLLRSPEDNKPPEAMESKGSVYNGGVIINDPEGTGDIFGGG